MRAPRRERVWWASVFAAVMVMTWLNRRKDAFDGMLQISAGQSSVCDP